MATIWQWQGDATDGAGYIRILSGSSSVPITGTVTLAAGTNAIGTVSGTVTLAAGTNAIGTVSGTVTLASGSATIGVISGTVTLASGSATIGVISGNVTLTGRTIALTYLFNAVAITDTDTRTQDVSISSYKNITIICVNSLNQALTVNLRVDGAPLYQWDGANFTLASMTIPASTEKSIVINTRYPLLNNIIGSTLGLAAVASVAPASGSFTAYIQGAVN